MIEGYRTTHHNLLKLFQFAYVAQATYTFYYDFSLLLFFYHIVIAALIGRGFSDPTKKRNLSNRVMKFTTSNKNNSNHNNNSINQRMKMYNELLSSSDGTNSINSDSSIIKNDFVVNNNPRMRLAKTFLCIAIPILVHVVIYLYYYQTSSSSSSSSNQSDIIINNDDRDSGGEPSSSSTTFHQPLFMTARSFDKIVSFFAFIFRCEKQVVVNGIGVLSTSLSEMMCFVSESISNSFWWFWISNNDDSSSSNINNSDDDLSTSTTIISLLSQRLQEVVALLMSSTTSSDNNSSSSSYSSSSYFINLALNYTQETIILRKNLASSSVLPMTFMIDRCSLLWILWLDVMRGFLAFAMLSVDCHDEAYRLEF